jgi:hypothetical protein
MGSILGLKLVLEEYWKMYSHRNGEDWQAS